MNKVVLIGRLAKDVEMRTVGDNISVANFTLAVDRRFKRKNEDQPSADFIPVTAWRKTAEFAGKYFHKGKQVYAFGSLETYSYEKDGEQRYGFRVNADELGFADSAPQGENASKERIGGSTQNLSDFAEPTDFSDPSGLDMIDDGDDLPF